MRSNILHSIVELNQNFRSHPSILKYPNEVFYAGHLEARADPVVIESLCRWERLVRPGLPIVFHAISGTHCP